MFIKQIGNLFVVLVALFTRLPLCLAALCEREEYVNFVRSKQKSRGIVLFSRALITCLFIRIALSDTALLCIDFQLNC